MTQEENSDLPPLAERRPGPRQRVLLGGIFAGDGGRFVLSCKIRDITASGARISIARHQRLPGSFFLINVRERVAHRAFLRWRRNDEMGLLFGGTVELAGAVDPAVTFLK